MADGATKTVRQSRGALLELEKSEAALIVAASETDANLYYASGFLAGDPIAYCQIGERRLLLLPELELGRGRDESSVDEVVSLQPYDRQVREETGRAPKLAEMLVIFFRERGIETLTVPASFPVGHADRLRDSGFEVRSLEDPFFPGRAVKTDEEIAHITQSQAMTVEAMDLAIGLIRRSEVRGDHLELDGHPLTAEEVRRQIHRFLFERGYRAENTIVAGADQACDPHVRGSGVLPAHSPIVIDIFPRSVTTRYWGDMTRTVLRGEASKAVTSLYRDVRDAHQLGLEKLRDRVDGNAVHRAVQELFESRGRETGEVDGHMQGYFHSTGHGLGLDVHEHPKIGRIECPLQAGNTVTIEPGLYYPGLGGVRIEDTVLITETGHRNLTDYPCDLVV